MKQHAEALKRLFYKQAGSYFAERTLLAFFVSIHTPLLPEWLGKKLIV